MTASGTATHRPARVLPGWAWLPIPLLLAVGIVCLALDFQTVFQPPYLLPALNLIFSTGMAVLVAVLAARSYLAAGSPSVLLMGAGMLIFGLSSYVAGVLASLRDPNDAITLFNVALVGSGLCHLLSAIPRVAGRTAPGRYLHVVTAYGGALGGVAGLGAAVRGDWLPEFFVPGQGATAIRQIVLANAILLFTLAAGQFWRLYRRAAAPFLGWYALGLGLITLGLVVLLFLKAVGTPLNWVGRSAQYVGGVYLLLAVRSAIRRAGGWRLPLEEALRESEEKFARMFQASPVGVSLVAADGRHVEANDAMLALFGYAREEMVGRTAGELGTWQDETERERVIADLRRSGRVQGREARLVRKSGEVFPAMIGLDQVQIAGEPMLLGTVMYITVLKQAEAQLRTMGERLRLAQEAAQLGIHDYDITTGRIQWDARLHTLWGVGPDEVVTLDAFWTGVHPEDRAATQAALDRAMDPTGNGRYAAVYRVISRTDEVERWVAATGQVFFAEGRPARLVGTATDITEQKRAELALAASEDRFRRLFTHMASGFALGEVLLDAEGQPCDFRFLEVNAAFERQSGLSRAILGRRITEVLPHLERAWIDRYGRVAMTGEATNFRDFNQDTGRYYDVVCYRPAPGQFAIVFRDVSAEVKVEAALRQAFAENEKALATNQTLLREVHHRVKNNLQMLCDMLYLQMESFGEGEKADVLRDTYGRIYAVARLHEQLYQALHSGRVVLHEYLTRLVEGFRAVYAGAAVQVEADEGLTLDVDRAIHLGLLVNELVTNACKHAFRGREGEVVVTLRLVGEHLTLQVRDNGRGLPADLDLAESKSLGLRIVRILAQRLEGRLTIANHQGAIFTLTFPLHAALPVEPQ